MAAAFPEGLEFNVMQDPEASRTVFAQWPTPILISGFEIGEKIITGKRLAASDVQDSPVKDAYEMCLAQDDPAGRNSWDQSTVLVAVRGPENYYDVEKGTLSVNEDGSDRWEKSEDGPHARLMVKMPVEEVTRIIEDLMMHRPVSGK